MRLRATRLISAGRGRPAWTPAQIPTALWLDAADSSTIILNGSTVSQWNDRSGNARNATQATVANQPTYQGAGLIYLDGVDDSMSYTLSGFTTQGTAIVLFRPDSDTNYALIQSNTLDYTRFSGDGNSYPITFRTVRLTAAGGFTDTGIQFQEITANTSPASYRMWRNGVSVFNSTGAFTFGNLPDRVGGGQPFKGWVYEIIVCDYVVSTQTRQQIEGYLAWKWGGL